VGHIGRHGQCILPHLLRILFVRSVIEALERPLQLRVVVDRMYPREAHLYGVGSTCLHTHRLDLLPWAVHDLAFPEERDNPGRALLLSDA